MAILLSKTCCMAMQHACNERESSLVSRRVLTRGRGAQVLTPRQYAQALVASYPYLPDALALAGCMAAASAPCGASARAERDGSPAVNPGTSADSRASVKHGAGSGQQALGGGSPPSTSSAQRADPLLVSAWPRPPPAVRPYLDPGSEGAELTEGHAGRERSPERGAAAERTLKQAPPSGEVQTVSGHSLTSAFPKVAAHIP